MQKHIIKYCRSRQELSNKYFEYYIVILYYFFLQILASIQTRTSPINFDYSAENSESGAISNPSTKGATCGAPGGAPGAGGFQKIGNFFKLNSEFLKNIFKIVFENDAERKHICSDTYH